MQPNQNPQPPSGPVVPPTIYPSPAPPTVPVPPPAQEPPRRRREGWRSVGGTVLLLILAPLLALLITAFGFQSYQVDGASMETTLSSGDRLIVNKIPRTWSRVTNKGYVPQRGDVVIFNHVSSIAANIGGSKQLIKRVIALPGESVIVADGVITVSSPDRGDSFNPDTNGGYQIRSQKTPGDMQVTLAEDELFVVGDNRANSEDSRFFGPIKLKQLVGKLSIRIMPVDKLQKF